MKTMENFNSDSFWANIDRILTITISLAVIISLFIFVL
jgi:hypothetical protein